MPNLLKNRNKQDEKQKMFCISAASIDLEKYSSMSAEELEETDFELISTAKQTDPRYGDFQYSLSDIKEMAKNHNEDVRGVEIAVDLNHERSKKAYAWIKPGSMYVAPSTNLDGENSLYCKLYRFTPEGKDLVSTGAFRYFSIELYRKYKRAIGEKYKVFKNVITGLALTNDPVVADLAPTFSKDEGKQLSINNNDMLLKNMVKKLSKQEFVSETEKELLTMTFSAADEDAQEEYEEAVEEIKEKPEQEEASDNPEVAELSKAVKTLQKENAELRLSQKKDAAVAFSKQFAVSDENKVGFAKADMKDVEALALTFSKEQQDAFKELFGKIQLSEAGEIGDAEAEGDETEEAQVKALAKETEEGESSVVSYSKGELELEKLTKTYMKNNPDVPYLKAYAKVLDANPHLAE